MAVTLHIRQPARLGLRYEGSVDPHLAEGCRHRDGICEEYEAESPEDPWLQEATEIKATLPRLICATDHTRVTVDVFGVGRCARGHPWTGQTSISEGD